MKKKRALNGTGRRFAIINRYRQCFSSKSRKVRCDAIAGEEIQRFCHESQWGGRIDTLKLAKQPVLVELWCGTPLTADTQDLRSRFREIGRLLTPTATLSLD